MEDKDKPIRIVRRQIDIPRHKPFTWIEIHVSDPVALGILIFLFGLFLSAYILIR